MVLSRKRSLIQALHVAPRGKPLGSQRLRELGIAPGLASYYSKSGWLDRLGRGVFRIPEDKLTTSASIRFLEGKIPGLHVGGKTALDWQGTYHNLYHRQRLTLWGTRTARLPGWFKKEFHATYTSRRLFDSRLPADFALVRLPEDPEGPLVSAPERALLELLASVGTSGKLILDDTKDIVEGFQNPRPEVLQRLIRHCVRVKVVRLCVQWAEELKLDWAPLARKASGERGGHGRWVSRLRDGTLLVLKP